MYKTNKGLVRSQKEMPSHYKCNKCKEYKPYYKYSRELMDKEKRFDHVCKECVETVLQTEKRLGRQIYNPLI